MPLNSVKNIAAQASHAWPKQYVHCAMLESLPTENRPTQTLVAPGEREPGIMDKLVLPPLAGKLAGRFPICGFLVRTRIAVSAQAQKRKSEAWVPA
jgi:hypothetical protein